VAALSILTIVIGLGAEVVMQFAIRAAADLGDPSQYVKAVMEGRP
jgi:hypothetical protein